MRKRLIALLGGATQDQVMKAYRNGREDGKVLANEEAHGKALDVLNVAYDIVTEDIRSQRYHGVAKAAVDDFNRVIVARLRDKFKPLSSLSIPNFVISDATISSHTLPDESIGCFKLQDLTALNGGERISVQ